MVRATMAGLKRMRGAVAEALGTRGASSGPARPPEHAEVPPPLTPEEELERLAGLAGAPIEERLAAPLLDHWMARLAEHHLDSYAGVPLAKFAEDLRVYEHLLWADRPNVVLEIGTFKGG